MCQIQNRYVQRDAVRNYAFKVMRKSSGGLYAGRYHGTGNAAGVVLKATGRSRLAAQYNRFDGGAFHVFCHADEAMESMKHSDTWDRLRVVMVAVDGYIATGTDGMGHVTALYHRIMILGEF